MAFCPNGLTTSGHSPNRFFYYNNFHALPYKREEPCHTRKGKKCKPQRRKNMHTFWLKLGFVRSGLRVGKKAFLLLCVCVLRKVKSNHPSISLLSNSLRSPVLHLLGAIRGSSTGKFRSRACETPSPFFLFKGLETIQLLFRVRTAENSG